MVFYETMRNSFFGCSYGFRKIMSASKLLLLLNQAAAISSVSHWCCSSCSPCASCFVCTSYLSCFFAGALCTQRISLTFAIWIISRLFRAAGAVRKLHLFSIRGILSRRRLQMRFHTINATNPGDSLSEISVPCTQPVPLWQALSSKSRCISRTVSALFRFHQSQGIASLVTGRRIFRHRSGVFPSMLSYGQ